MEEILQEIKSLGPEDLRLRLIEHGVSVGPILPSTKLLFQRKLARIIYEKDHPPAPDDSATGENDSAGPKEEIEAKQSQLVTKAPETLVVTKDEPVTNPLESSVYYGVCLPLSVSQEDFEGQDLVFTDKELALKAVKKFSGARFKFFKSKPEAEKFSKQSPDEIASSPRRPNGNKQNGNGAISTLGTGVSVESCPFKGPKQQELTKLRKTIEAGDVQSVETLIWENPRYLISSGDTPVILMEGPRYNALHIAAKSNQASMCQLLLDTLEDPSYVDKLYGHTMETDSTRSNRINFIVDLYLNTPDKGCCESPLHFACKFGFPEVVAVLIAHPKTDKYMRNRDGATPKDVICCRSSEATEAHKAEIRELLEGQYFVPLIRSEDNTTQPMIGTPWSPECTRGNIGVPPLSWSPKDPLMAVKACAGPMTPSKADLYHKRWTIPPSGSPDYVKRKFVMTKREDSDKGLERIGRELAHDMNIPWVEYWDFLQTYADLSTEDGLDLLEEYLQKQSLALCIEEALGKLDLLSNSFHSFRYNQMDSSQQNDSTTASMNNSWLTSPLEDIQESKQESISESNMGAESGVLGGALDRSPGSNITPPRPVNDPLKRSLIKMDESFSTPVRTIYDYGRMNRSMDCSMDSSDWSQDSFTGVLTPVSCLVALFAKLSLIDRSRRHRRLTGGGGPGCFSTTCMGGGHPGYVKTDVNDDKKREVMNGSVIIDKSEIKEVKQNGTAGNYIREARLVLDSNKPDGPSAKRSLEESLRRVQFEKGDSESEKLDLDDQKTEKETEVKSENSQWRDFSLVSSASSDSREEQSVSEILEESTEYTSDSQPQRSIKDLIDKFEKTDLNSEVESTSPNTEETKVESKTPTLLERMSNKNKNMQSYGKRMTQSMYSTPQKARANSGQLDIVMELDKEKVSSYAYQSMFEILNERKNVENQRIGEKRRVIYSRDIVLDMSGVKLENDEVLINVAIIPPNSTVAEMTVFSRLPFFVKRGEFCDPEDLAISRLPVMVDVNFNFGKDCITSALAVNNRSRGKIFFINGYQPCKSDLDVFRAMTGSEVDKETYPLVHRWKTLVSSRVANPSCSWPSPSRARHHGNLSASFPQVSSPRQIPESPVIFYRSPIMRTPTRNRMSNTWSMPNIKAQLFPSSPLKGGKL